MCATNTESTVTAKAVVRFASTIRYEPERIHAAAVYCSDGRVGDHFDDFLHNGLNLPRYDRLALPGGPAALAGHTEAHVAEQGVVDELKFLVEAHELDRIVLIAHQGCAFYSQRLQLPEPFLEHQQRIDLLKAKLFVERITGLTKIDTFFARRDGESGISFEEVVMP
jgi:hypothetical protein